MQSIETFESEVEILEAGQRIDQWLASKLLETSRSQIKKWIQNGHVMIDGEVSIKGSVKLKQGQIVVASLTKPAGSELTPVDLSIEVVYEDEDLIVVNKRAGIVVHPGAGTKDPTLVEGVLFHVGKLAGGGEFRPGVVHRLDKDTSGLIVFAKNDYSHAGLSAQFANKTNLREYVALLDGGLAEPEVTVESFLHRDPSNRLRFTFTEVDDFKRKNGQAAVPGFRWAKSVFYKQLDFGRRLSLCYVRLHTGRTHQIRVHAKQIGAPIIGDLLYHRETVLPADYSPKLIQYVKKLSRQMLHARLLGFEHPRTGEQMSFESTLPNDFKELLHLLKPYAEG